MRGQSKTLVRLSSSAALLAVLGGCSSSPPANAGAGGQSSAGLSGAPSSAGNAGLAAAAGSSASAGESAAGGGENRAGANGAGAGGATSESGGTAPGGSGGVGPATVVDASSMTGKQLFGYQGWFACPGDGGPTDRWQHWFRNNTPSAESATFDLWPDVRELGADELFATNMTLQAGAGPARVFSSFNAKTVARHFAWMKSAGIDGVFVQRFLADVKDLTTRQVRDQVLLNARAGAEANGRVFTVMYDISGANPATLVADLQAEWHYLVEVLKVTESPRYLHHRGKPVLAVWGFGFSDRPASAAQAASIIADLRTGKYPVSLVGGVPTGWRTLSDDSQTASAWAAVYRSFDVISPWSVGRYVDDAGADRFAKEHLTPDLAELKPLGIDYLPVVFPGFSWHNLNGDALNQIPRRGGAFYWRQVYNALKLGSDMLYGAMFDEVDEGTAFFKVAPAQADLPAQGTFLSLAADGKSLPSDWYLKLAGAATRALRGELAPTTSLPISP
jgi:hypothetical protein